MSTSTNRIILSVTIHLSFPRLPEDGLRELIPASLMESCKTMIVFILQELKGVWPVKDATHQREYNKVQIFQIMTSSLLI